MVESFGKHTFFIFFCIMLNRRCEKSFIKFYDCTVICKKKLPPIIEVPIRKKLDADSAFNFFLKLQEFIEKLNNYFNI